MQPDETPTMKKQKLRTSQLEQDMIFEIMLGLPLKSVLRFKALSKQWCNIITDSVFARAHLSKHQDISSFIIRTEDMYNPRISIINVKEAEKASSRGELFQQVSIPLPTSSIKKLVQSIIIDHNKTLHFQNCCDGILCASFIRSGRIFLWNPITKWTKEIDCSDKIDYVNKDFVGFGYDSSIKDYKVVRIAPKHIEVMNLKSNTWRVVSSVLPECLRSLKRSYTIDGYLEGRGFISSSPVHLNGNLYWEVRIDGLENVIISFDLKKEKLNIVQKPSEDLSFGSETKITSFRGKLCLIVYRHPTVVGDGIWYQVWLMKEENNWDKVFDLKFQRYPMHGRHVSPICGVHEAIIFRNHIKRTDLEFIVVDSENRESYKNIMVSYEMSYCYRPDVTQYVGSLISPQT